MSSGSDGGAPPMALGVPSSHLTCALSSLHTFVYADKLRKNTAHFNLVVRAADDERRFVYPARSIVTSPLVTLPIYVVTVIVNAAMLKPNMVLKLRSLLAQFTSMISCQICFEQVKDLCALAALWQPEASLHFVRCRSLVFLCPNDVVQSDELTAPCKHISKNCRPRLRTYSYKCSIQNMHDMDAERDARAIVQEDDGEGQEGDDVVRRAYYACFGVVDGSFMYATYQASQATSASLPDNDIPYYYPRCLPGTSSGSAICAAGLPVSYDKRDATQHSLPSFQTEQSCIMTANAALLRGPTGSGFGDDSEMSYGYDYYAAGGAYYPYSRPRPYYDMDVDARRAYVRQREQTEQHDHAQNRAVQLSRGSVGWSPRMYSSPYDWRDEPYAKRYEHSRMWRRYRGRRNVEQQSVKKNHEV